MASCPDGMDGMNIGFVGLGSIGTEMVKRLCGAGFPVTVYARGKGLDEARGAGASVTDDHAALGAGSDLLILCLFNDDQLGEVMFERGTLAAMRPGTVVAIHTTGSPQLMRELQARAPEDVSVIEATFSGGGHDVAAGRLVVMAGGSPEALERARPALASYADRIHHVGALGNAQLLKLINNLLFATNLMNAAEALKLMQAEGFEPAQVATIIQQCSGASYAMNMFIQPAPLETRLAMAWPYLEKDVATAIRVGTGSGLDMSLFQQAGDYYRGPD